MNPIYLVISLISVVLNICFLSKCSEDIESTTKVKNDTSYISKSTTRTLTSPTSRDIENNILKMLSLRQYHESVKL